MRIEDTFFIKSFGLVLTPSFDLPSEKKWVNISEIVTIETPDGKEVCAEALFSVAHLNIKDPSASVNKRWPILIALHGIKQGAVPVGSKVYVTPLTKKTVIGSNA